MAPFDGSAPSAHGPLTDPPVAMQPLTKRTSAVAVAAAAAAASPGDEGGEGPIAAPPALASGREWHRMSYSAQWDALFGDASAAVDNSVSVPKPDSRAQAGEPHGARIAASHVTAVRKRPVVRHRWMLRDYAVVGFMTSIHAGCLLAPSTFSWSMLSLFIVLYFVTGCLGITLCYHRLLSHRSFVVPKWLEYTLAYCGVLAVEGDPIEWVSNHRFHHQHTDEPLDPHSAYEGFWWAHMGWLMDNEMLNRRVGDRSNVGYLRKQFYYRFLAATFPLHVGLQYAVLYMCGGLPAVVWGGCVRQVWVFHITWLVNSASHLWGSKAWDTGDLSRNNWWVGLLAFGEGWHNNHHAFEFSARHGLEWWQLDVTWLVIKALEAAGLAWSLQYPSERQKDRLRVDPAVAAAAVAK